MATRERIGYWLNEHDPYLEQPCKALDAGYTLEELTRVYLEVFETDRQAAIYLAQDLLKHYGAE